MDAVERVELTSLSEQITLFGGPRDGESVGWRGGDIIEFPAGPSKLDFSVQTVEPFRQELHTYRRSIKTRNIFVYQP